MRTLMQDFFMNVTNLLNDLICIENVRHTITI